MSNPAEAKVDPTPQTQVKRPMLSLASAITTLDVAAHHPEDRSAVMEDVLQGKRLDETRVDERYARLLHLRKRLAAKPVGPSVQSPEDRAEREADMWSMQRAQAQVMNGITDDDNAD